MHVCPPDNAVETIRRETTLRVCPGCGGSVDLGEYGVLTRTTSIVCRTCGLSFTLSELIRV